MMNISFCASAVSFFRVFIMAVWLYSWSEVDVLVLYDKIFPLNEERQHETDRGSPETLLEMTGSRFPFQNSRHHPW